jgi:hypothetical protein
MAYVKVVVVAVAVAVALVCIHMYLTCSLPSGLKLQNLR